MRTDGSRNTDADGRAATAPTTHSDSWIVSGSRSFLRSTLPGVWREPSLRTVQGLLATPPATLVSLGDHQTRRLCAAALIVAGARHGSAAEAVSLAESELDRRLLQQDLALPAVTISTFWGAVSEAYATAGLSRRGTQAARKAFEFAREARSDPLQYRAKGVLAASLALNGAFVLAEEAIEDALDLEVAHDWPPTPASHLLLVGRILVSSARGDRRTLAEVAERLRAMPERSATSAGLAALADAATALYDNRAGDGIAALVAAAGGTDEPTVPQLLRDFTVSYQSLLLVVRREPWKALALLEDRESPRDHTVCLGLERAYAYLQLGDDRQALLVTDPCFQRGLKHCLRQLPSVLLCRAIAHQRLGHQDAADNSFSDAFHLMHRSGAVTPLLTLPHDQIETLLRRFRHSRPDLARAVDALQRRVLAVPAVEPLGFLPPLLSERETLIVQQLRTGATLGDIATALYVSRNTVKTQAASLYRKLGAASRDEAVALLERAGYFDYPR